CQQSHRSPPAF
nr:immunoglobulin light chain junction region [Macaca mulatta]